MFVRAVLSLGHLISGQLLTLARMITEHTQEEQELAPIHVSEPHMLLSGTDAETRRPETEFKQAFLFLSYEVFQEKHIYKILLR